MDIILIVIMFIIGLLLLITLHEFGHFIFAKLFGVYCFEFSIGFGKKFIRKKKKYSETFFCVGWIPLGGYVAMFGEDDDESEKRKAKQKQVETEVLEQNKKPEEYSEFTVIDRKVYKVYKKQQKLLNQELIRLKANNLKFRDLVKLNIQKELAGLSEEEVINVVATENVCRQLNIERLIVEEDFYKVVDQDHLPTDRDLEHINRGKKFCIMGAGITMNFIVGYLLYVISLTCFPHYAITSRYVATKDANTELSQKLNQANEGLEEGYSYIGGGEYYIFEEDLYNESKEIRINDGLGTAIVHDKEDDVYTVTVPTNQFTYNDLALDKQLYRVENEKNIYNFYEVVAASDFGASTFESYKAANADKIESSEGAKEFFDIIEGKKFVIDEEDGQSKQVFIVLYGAIKITTENLKIIKNVPYQLTKDGAGIDSVDLTLSLEKAKLDENRDAGYYVDVNNLESTSISSTLKMDKEKGLLDSTGIDFGHHERWLGGEGFVYAGEKWADGTALIFKTVGGLFVGQGWDQVGGPIAILSQSTTIFRNNPFSIYIQMWGLISVNLAVMNLLPIPGLDGWHLLVTVVESIIRKKLHPGFKKWASRIGLFVVFGLMAAVLILDALRLFGIAI